MQKLMQDIKEALVNAQTFVIIIFKIVGGIAQLVDMLILGAIVALKDGLE